MHCHNHAGGWEQLKWHRKCWMDGTTHSHDERGRDDLSMLDWKAWNNSHAPVEAGTVLPPVSFIS